MRTHEAEWVPIPIIGSDYEIEVDTAAGMLATESQRYRFKPRTCAGEPEGIWLPGRPPEDLMLQR